MNNPKKIALNAVLLSIFFFGYYLYAFGYHLPDR